MSNTDVANTNNHNAISKSIDIRSAVGLEALPGNSWIPSIEPLLRRFGAALKSPGSGMFTGMYHRPPQGDPKRGIPTNGNVYDLSCICMYSINIQRNTYTSHTTKTYDASRLRKLPSPWASPWRRRPEPRCMVNGLYSEEFARLAETRLAQNTLVYVKLV